MSAPEYRNARRRIAFLFSIPLAFSLLFFGANLGSEHNESRILDLQLLHSQVEGLRDIANDAEIGEHGFLISGDDRYAATLQSAMARMRVMGSSIRVRHADRDLQPAITRLIDLVGKRVDVAAHVLDIERTQGLKAAIEDDATDLARPEMDQIRETDDRLQKQIEERTALHIVLDQRLNGWTFLFFLVGTMTMLVVIVWLYNSFVSYMQARDQAHAELRQLNEDLEHRIDVRTQELRLFNEELQQFAYVASHDLQEPLRTIVSFTQLLGTRYKGRLDADADEFLGYIVNSARRMTDLINGLLALVRLRKTGQPVEPVAFNMLVDEAVGSLQGSIHENGAKIEVAPLPDLIVDRLQFQQVFQNLISNAIKYRDTRSPVIRIDAVRDETYWNFSVVDNGRGFDPQFAERIFAMFQRLHGRDIEGTGMGLSLARKIVDRHGGRIWAEGESGVGATFFFSLPVSLETRAASEAGADHVGAASA